MKLTQTQIVQLGTIAAQQAQNLQKALLQAITNINQHNANAQVTAPIDTTPFSNCLPGLESIAANLQKHISGNLSALPKEPAPAPPKK